MKKRRAKGTGSIVKRSDRDLYEGRITVGYKEDGTRKTKSVYAKTKKEVQRKLDEIVDQIKAGAYCYGDNITIYELGLQVIEEKKLSNEVKENTYFRDKETLKRLSKIYDTPVKEATVNMIKTYFYEKLDYSQSTINKDYTMLRMIFREAVNRGLIKESPMDRIKKPKSRQKHKKVRALTLEEQRKLLQALDDDHTRFAPQILISMFTGMRMGEVNALTCRDINFNFNKIVVNKTISRGEKGEAIVEESTKTAAGMRKIPIPKQLMDLFKTLCMDKSPDEYLFTAQGGRTDLVTTEQVNSAYNRLLKKYDIIDDSVDGKVTLHSLRHTYATRCIESGMKALTLKELLGHTDIKVTLNTYCDVFEIKDEEIEQCYDYLSRKGLSYMA